MNIADFLAIKKQMKRSSWRLIHALRSNDTKELKEAAIEYLDTLEVHTKFVSELIRDIRERNELVMQPTKD